MDAQNAPVRRPRPETFTGDLDIHQKPAITQEDRSVVVPAPEAMKADYLEQLAFNEEPVTIRIEQSSEKFPARVVDAWVNGKGAEIWMNNRWVETRAIPIGMECTTKRKYVEVLLRSKIDTIQTDSGKIDAYSEKNEHKTFTSRKSPLSVIEDRSPRGAAWLRELSYFG